MDRRRVETLVQEECRGVRRERGEKQGPRLSGAFRVSTAVQRCTSLVEDRHGPSMDAMALHLALPHHFRCRMNCRLADQYTEAVWDALPQPRKFFLKWRGFAACDDRKALPEYRQLFLRAALEYAERATNCAPHALECASLKVHVLVQLAKNKGKGGKKNYCKQAVEECQRVLNLLAWTDAHVEWRVLYEEKCEVGERLMQEVKDYFQKLSEFAQALDADNRSYLVLQAIGLDDCIGEPLMQERDLNEASREIDKIMGRNIWMWQKLSDPTNHCLTCGGDLMEHASKNAHPNLCHACKEAGNLA